MPVKTNVCLKYNAGKEDEYPKLLRLKETNSVYLFWAPGECCKVHKPTEDGGTVIGKPQTWPAHGANFEPFKGDVILTGS